MGAIIGGILWIILCALTATLAERKGHKGIGYFLLALFLSSLIGLIIVACISNKTQKLCPYCKKAIDIHATVCGFCGKELTKKNSTNAEKEKWISERIVELISTGKTATDAKIQAEAEYSVEKNNKEEKQTNRKRRVK